SFLNGSRPLPRKFLDRIGGADHSGGLRIEDLLRRRSPSAKRRDRPNPFAWRSGSDGGPPGGFGMRDPLWRRWWRSLWQPMSTGRNAKGSRKPRSQPRLEELENRVTPAAPVVTSILRTTPTGQFTNATSVSYTVNFNQAVTGVDATDFAVTTNGAVAITPPVV